jgi:hypothetical protein
VVGDSQVEVPTGRALTVKVYVWASAVFAEWANVILAVVGIGKVIRSGEVLVGEYVTWYSIAADPHS